MFTKQIIKIPNAFNIFSDVCFEHIAKGRWGSIIVDVGKQNTIPIVRTTTKYDKPVQLFSREHYMLIKKIMDLYQKNNLLLRFNNAMIEIYNNQYRKMGFHTDQSLDLEDDSFICLFSCYKTSGNLRTLVVKNKKTGIEKKIILDECSVVLFSTPANKQHVHKIILENIQNNEQTKDQKWLGITFRLSKSFVEFINNKPILNNKELTLATELQKKEFMKLKGTENRLVDFSYPEITYTISPSDLLSLMRTK